MVIFHSFLLVYQRVSTKQLHSTRKKMRISSSKLDHLGLNRAEFRSRMERFTGGVYHVKLWDFQRQSSEGHENRYLTTRTGDFYMAGVFLPSRMEIFEPSSPSPGRSSPFYGPSNPVQFSECPTVWKDLHGSKNCRSRRELIQILERYMGMDQYLLIPFLGGWTSIYQLFWCSPGVQGFDTLPYGSSSINRSRNK